MTGRRKTNFRIDRLYTRNELVRRARKVALATARTVVLLDLSRKQHAVDDLLFLFYEDWLPRILEVSAKGMYACPLEFNHFTEDLAVSKEEQTLRKEELEERIRTFFFKTGFKLLKFEHWKSERDLLGVMFYVSWG